MARHFARAKEKARRWVLRRGFESRLTWVLGSPRSGSTWLLQLLSEHPAVVPINEPLIGWYFGFFLSDLPGWRPTLDVRNFTLRKVQENKRDQFFAREFADVVLPELGNMMLARFRAHALRYPPASGARRCAVVVKEPSGSQSADLILPALPKSRVLFLLRDGRDVVDSELSANLEGSWVTSEFPGARGLRVDERHDFVIRSAQKWLWRTAVVEEAMRRHSGPTLVVKYEDLLLNPVDWLVMIFAWLDQPIERDQAQQIVNAHAFDRLGAEERGMKRFYRAAQPGLWRENLTPEEQESVLRLIGPKLGALGYDVTQA